MSSSRKVANAAIFNLLFSFFAAVVQICIAGVMARLLRPDHYGTFAFANAILVYIMHISQKGLTSNLVIGKEVSPELLGDTYLMCIFMSIFTFIAVISVAVVVHVIYGDRVSSSIEIMVFMVLPLIVQIMSSPATAILQRRINFFTLGLLSLTSIIIGNGVVGIVCAKSGLGAWSLAFSNGAATAIVSIGAIIFGQAPTRFRWHPPSIFRTLVDSMQFNVVRSLDVAWLQAPIIFLGGMLSPSVIGIYQRIQFLADLAMQMTIWRVSSVLYAAFAIEESGGSFDKFKYRTIFTILSTLTIPVCGFIWYNSLNIISAVLGPQWVSGDIVLKILIIAFGLNTLNQAAGMTLEHLRWFKWRYFTSGLGVVTVVLFQALLPIHALWAIAYPSLLSMMIVSFALHFIAGERLRDIPDLISCMLPGLVWCASAIVGSYFASLIVVHFQVSSIETVGLSFVLGALACLFSSPFVFRLVAMKPAVEVWRRGFPGLFQKCRFVHGCV